ncbi:unnamed protein product [Rhizoctonia solani]|uniref:Uncharacterized protein n=1 Tax=Rhizoctonia solani TaxID=456999 RepID=A0A8H3H789_9AGAM|nr:unnamed protein product [Rhizoctonia solani]
MTTSANLIIVLYSEYSRVEALNHIGRMSKHRSGSFRQLVFPDQNINPPVTDRKPQSQSKLALLTRKDKKQVNDLSPPSWMEMVIGARKFISNHYSSGDKIILFGLSGGIAEDFPIVNSMVIELVKQLVS